MWWKISIIKIAENDLMWLKNIRNWNKNILPLKSGNIETVDSKKSIMLTKMNFECKLNI